MSSAISSNPAMTVIQTGKLHEADRQAKAAIAAGRRSRWGKGKRAVILGGGLTMIFAAGTVWTILGNLHEENVNLHDEIVVLTTDKNGLEQEVGFLESVRTKLVSKLDIATAGREAAESHNRELTIERNALNGEVDKLTGTVDVLMDKVTTGKVRIASLEQTNREKARSISELSEIRDNLVVKNFDLQQSRDQAEAKVVAVTEDRNALAVQIASLRDRQLELEDAMRGLSSQNVIVAQENQDLQSRVETLTEQIQLKDAEIAALREVIAATESSNSSNERVAAAEETATTLVLE